MSNGVSAQSGPAFKNVIVEYIDSGNGVEVTPDTPLPVTGTFTTNPETPLDVFVTNDSENPVPITGNVTVSGGSNNLPEADPLPVFQPVSQGAFGDQLVANLSQEIALMFNYGIDSDIINTYTSGTGSVTASNSRMLVASGATSNSVASAKSRYYLRYRPGFGGLARFTMGITKNVTGSEQTGGIGSEEDGLFFSYRNNTMNIVRRYGGAREIRELTITTGSNSANNVTITLDGTVYTVAVSANSGNANQTATNIATNFSSTSWLAYAKGNIVVFRAITASSKAGAFSFSAGSTGAVATLSLKVTGTAASEDVIPQSSWNYDKADGNGTLPNLDWSLGNIFQIKYQWLGYGMIQFFIEDPELGRFIRVHAIKYANTSTNPTVYNPTFPFYFYATNGEAESNVSMFTASCGGFIEGNTNNTTGGNQKVYTVNNSCGSSGTLLATLYNKSNYLSKNSRVQMAVLNISCSAADAVTFSFYRNSTLTGTASWTTVGVNSAVYYDTSSTGYSGGDLVNAIRCEHQTNNNLAAFNVQNGIIAVHPNDTLSVVATSDAGTVKVGISINWIEYL